MHGENLIKPMKFGVGEGDCPNCGNKMIVVDIEMNYMFLDDENIPYGYSTEYTRIEAICKVCGNIYPMRRMGLGYEMVSKLRDIERKYFRSKEMKGNNIDV